MRKILYCFPLVLLMVSCDWKPDEIAVQQAATLVKYNIAIGDTVVVDIEPMSSGPVEVESPDMEVLEISSQWSLDSGSQLRLIGKSEGAVNIYFEYDLHEANDASAQSGSYFIGVSVTESIPLNVSVGEETLLDISSNLSLSQLSELDSVAVSGENGASGTVIVENVPDDQTSLIIVGEIPGVTELSIEGYDIAGVQIFALFYQVNISIHKRVVAELFTNAGCTGCPEANDYLDINIDTYLENLTVIRYHVWWPGEDPMYDLSAQRSEERYYYYSPPYIVAPTLIIDGSSLGGLVDVDGWSAIINQQMDNETRIQIWDASVLNSSDSMFVSYRIQNFGTSVTNVSVWSVLTEDSIYYAGTNGEDNHNQVMRDMNSTSIMEFDNNFLVQHALHLPPDFNVSEDFNLILMIQDESDKQIMQSRKFNILDLYPESVY